LIPVSTDDRVSGDGLGGSRVRLRPVRVQDRDRLLEIRSTAQVRRWWGTPYDDEDDADGADDTTHRFVIELEDRVVGLIQYGEELDHMYRHANIDLYLDPAVHGRGLGQDAVRTLGRYLLDVLGHHRLVIDPAADNEPAIRCYTAVGFRPVGVMRAYERDPEGTGWHDGLLMDLLRGDLR
jgi:aminoglycoside 6'-N-acetyltransferase